MSGINFWLGNARHRSNNLEKVDAAKNSNHSSKITRKYLKFRLFTVLRIQGIQCLGIQCSLGVRSERLGTQFFFDIFLSANPNILKVGWYECKRLLVVCIKFH